ncbi:hypothetical protein GGH94_001785 [Coemansia aciculifera]|uniref:TFIIS N-terminal domain-containing protein n=1 Tax=Coemansia aciculifera TaxID=417176 RepID=A0A9W8IMA1_9FUNG|nr:hypothetical protein GGH94_001785 [Coemansia aciculifera]KAJ2885461.1 hypothetical protein H4R27_001365 [Coemansia aciculifera]
MTPENLEPYDENLAKYGSKAKNRKDPSFADALKQAQEPSIAEALIRRRAGNTSPSDDNDDADGAEEGSASNSDDDDDDVDMQSAESDDQSTAKPKAGSRRSANSGRGRQPRASNKRASLGAASSDDDGPVAATPKRSRTTAREKYEHNTASPSTRRDSDDSRSATKDSPRSVTPEHKSSPGANKEEAKGERGSKSHQHSKNKNKSYQTLMQLRHRLQKTIIKGPIPDDLTPVHEVFRKLEDFDMTLELIQETKLGKVMRIIAVSDKLGDAPKETFDIKGRAIRLADKWRMLIVKRRDGSAEPVMPEEQLSRKSAEPEAKGERLPVADANIAADLPTPDESRSLPDTPVEATSPTTSTANLALVEGLNESAATSDAPHLEQQSRAAPAQGIPSI